MSLNQHLKQKIDQAKMVIEDAVWITLQKNA